MTSVLETVAYTWYLQMSQVSKLPVQSAASEKLSMEPNAEVQLSCLNTGIHFLLRYPPIFKVFTPGWQIQNHRITES